MPNCKRCSTGFEIVDSDREFYDRIGPVVAGKKFSVPEPTLCPDCRRQRRLSWRNERVLFQRDCDLCKQKTFSMYSEKADFPVYCIKCWWSDQWDPTFFGQDYDTSRSFFEQFQELRKRVPRMALMQSQNENSEYTNCVSHLKDCYLLFSSDFNRDCFYGVWIEKSKDCIDNILIDSCQLTYESIFAQNIYNSQFILFSNQCSDSAFLLDCRNCSNCFMSYGLRNKKFHIANKEYSEKEYFQKLKEFPMSSYSNLQKAKAHFFENVLNASNPHMRKRGTIIDSSGDFLTNAQNCIECYDLTEAKDCKYVMGGFEIKDAYDCCYVSGELGYENCECVPMPFNSISCSGSYAGSDLYYSDICMNNCKNLFGCVGLKHAEYMILNKKYSPDEYEKQVAQIIEVMQKAGEWGDFFPAKLSPFTYNTTEAQENYPLTKEECLARGYHWQAKDQREYQPQSYDIPDDIEDVPDEITKKILACVDCGKNYKVIAQELKLYRNAGLPVPRKCFECRHGDRMKLKNPRILYDRKCDKCSVDIKTTYSKERPEKIYCEPCYQESLS
ncbi:hypothetical protein KJ657_05530 [Patescibacteria group bacterium]|nr:hypothetical protein [Patescibacteria group bacterium]MBU1016518.1 hypothetical protein [Patescibacteria group bacterium]MBU1685103.1 hypothetical protein [Patescibacteria group bacterium]MBU1938603.1 hypothetical protein [Patescibacteria group bacterium]